MTINLIPDITYNIVKRGWDVSIFIAEETIWEGHKMKYYDLPKEERWLEGDDSPYQIGGRATDVSQIAYSLASRVKELYPINKVPEALVRDLEALEALCQQCENQIQETISNISDYFTRKTT